MAFSNLRWLQVPHLRASGRQGGHLPLLSGEGHRGQGRGARRDGAEGVPRHRPCGQRARQGPGGGLRAEPKRFNLCAVLSIGPLMGPLITLPQVRVLDLARLGRVSRAPFATTHCQ